jgi:uncharacterized repeat protein (TIGR02543 family)
MAGYTFNGWFLYDGTTFGFDAYITEDMTIYAHWTPIPVYTILINVVDVDGNQISDAAVYFGNESVTFVDGYWIINLPQPTAGIATAMSEGFLPGSENVSLSDFSDYNVAEITIVLEVRPYDNNYNNGGSEPNYPNEPNQPSAPTPQIPSQPPTVSEQDLEETEAESPIYTETPETTNDSEENDEEESELPFFLTEDGDDEIELDEYNYDYDAETKEEIDTEAEAAEYAMPEVITIQNSTQNPQTSDDQNFIFIMVSFLGLMASFLTVAWILRRRVKASN